MDAKLVSMPWTSLPEPSLGLAILKSSLSAAGFNCKIHHFNIFLLKHLSSETYDSIARSFALNDFIFTGVLDEVLDNEQIKLLNLISSEVYESNTAIQRHYSSAVEFQKTLLHIRSVVVPEYLEQCCNEILIGSPPLVGFTCMFDQTMASVALAKYIKTYSPATVVALGGYALEGETGEQILDCFPYIDVIVRGDGEEAIVKLVERVSDGNRNSFGGIPGTISQRDRHFVKNVPPARVPIDEIPIPDYDDFFDDLLELEKREAVSISLKTLPLETSRGCWWGQKSHCTFCGIDDDTMRYREKPADRVVEELDHFTRRYNPSSFRFNDYILPHSYFKTLIPVLASRKHKIPLGCELKANTSPDQLQLLSSAGFKELQPGIESFSTPILKHMRKGVTGLQNIRFLVNAFELGIRVNYNYLFGFPSDEFKDYLEITKIIPTLFHLQPPIDHNGVVLTRHSPLKEKFSDFGVKGPVRADFRYGIMFSTKYRKKHGFLDEKYAYYFEHSGTIPKPLKDVYSIIQLQLEQWKLQHSECDVVLSSTDFNDGMIVKDRRNSKEEVLTELGLLESSILRSSSKKEIGIRQLKEEHGKRFSTAQVVNSIDALLEQRLLFREGEKCLSLVIPESVYEQFPMRERIASWIAIKKN